MAKMSFKGLDEYARKLERMKKNTPETLGAGVYAMAEIVADEVKRIWKPYRQLLMRKISGHIKTVKSRN